MFLNKQDEFMSQFMPLMSGKVSTVLITTGLPDAPSDIECPRTTIPGHSPRQALNTIIELRPRGVAQYLRRNFWETFFGHLSCP